MSFCLSRGIAGLNIKGQTLHSWSGVGLGLEDAQTLAEKVMGVFEDKATGRKMTRTGHSEFQVYRVSQAEVSLESRFLSPLRGTKSELTMLLFLVDVKQDLPWRGGSRRRC